MYVQKNLRKILKLCSLILDRSMIRNTLAVITVKIKLAEETGYQTEGYYRI